MRLVGLLVAGLVLTPAARAQECSVGDTLQSEVMRAVERAGILAHGIGPLSNERLRMMTLNDKERGDRLRDMTEQRRALLVNEQTYLDQLRKLRDLLATAAFLHDQRATYIQTTGTVRGFDPALHGIDLSGLMVLNAALGLDAAPIPAAAPKRGE
jgi:hypothetical protein